MDLKEEKKLIQKAKQNPEVFGRLYEQHYPKIFGYILKRTANFEIAQDITSETFFKALKKLWQFHWKNIPFSSWLYRIANNEIANYFRKNKHKPVPLESIPEPFSTSNSNPSADILEAEEELKKHQDFLVLQKEISKLSAKYQEVIILRFFDKKQIKEIAEILGKREGTIKSLLHRGLEKLRQSVE
ncbi:MAG TPA: RNA polymerase sigma factor [Candidatus Nealsonbacteria bacterium]|uniref:RNA polymerase sigma-70 region 2 domain-containing protein n=1 Tax=marine sediment metagenome TaxID=412755 RepID=A0A0F9VSF8_9ZZZZ|nr:RNA polymerase sigma factor [Candidatus Nealsonbacteria bacterium]HEB46555.1 RNA polymerase sigma factor [Candidatus Nealsonbacteria bacterium]